MTRKVTLKQFVKKFGSQEKAAHAIGVAFATLNRWIKGHSKPSDMASKKLKEMGIKY